MSAWIILLVGAAYLALLFGVAWMAERMSHSGRSLVRNPYVYALSLAVYCTAWTFYGSVGKASADGLNFLAIYLGPSLAAPLWFVVLRKLILICRHQRISSIADFISARYGKSAFLGGLVASMAVVGIIPYISLQLKAISFSYDILSQGNTALGQAQGGYFYQDTAFYVAVVLAVFTIFFGTRHLDANDRHEGLVAAVAFESLVKLLAFVAVGLFVTYEVYQGVGDLFANARENAHLARLMDWKQSVNPWDWGWLMVISMFAVLFLPRQFHMAVVENTDPVHVDKATWLFPLYLLIINLFVLPVAFAGHLHFHESGADADTYVLGLPLLYGKQALALLVFIGGLSASTSMVIVATIALSIMVSNNIVMPLLLRPALLKESSAADLSPRLRLIRRLLILLILFTAYLYFHLIGGRTPLVSIGLISFVAVSQFAPAIIGGLFWKGATRAGAIAGLLGGFLVWAFCLPFPSLVEAGLLPQSILNEGFMGIHLLRPYAFLGLEGMDHISHAAFWSLLVNSLLYTGVSLYSRDPAIGRSQANLFVNIRKYVGIDAETPVWRGKAFLQDIRLLLHRFLGPERGEALLVTYAHSNRIHLEKTVEASAELVSYAERLLAGAVGSSSARLLVASVVKEEALSVKEVMKVMDEAQQLKEYSRELERKSQELERTSRKLQVANERLREMDQLKDDFIATVTHELRTPITSIRSLTNIVYDDENMPPEKKKEFLEIVIRESERISRLINQVLDLEKMESGHASLNMTEVDMAEVVRTSVAGIRQLCIEREIELAGGIPETISPIRGDRDRLMQVVVNLLSNAIKFCKHPGGLIEVNLYEEGAQMILIVRDNGIGIAPEVQPYIFDKFTQFNDHRSGRPQGSGLGLSISWRIVRIHEGNIRVVSEAGKGAAFIVHLPLRPGAVPPMLAPSYERRNEQQL